MSTARSSLESVNFVQSSDEFFPKGRHDTTRTTCVTRTPHVLGFLLGVLAGVILVAPLAFTQSHEAKSLKNQLAGELNGLVPNFTLDGVIFEEDPRATIDHETPESPNATREDWLSYMPVGNGFISVQNPGAYNLPPPLKIHGQDVYSLAFTHQLHCLHTIMDRYNGLLDGTASPHMDYQHIDHCFRYLRQSILCCGDTALEGQNPRHADPGTDGTGAVHICKSWPELYLWAEETRINDKKVI